ncbi:GntR family transcriptional regulator [Allonocardiopsis opalescens]|uniref:GntR family transcriptional regulator n=1 Tax=Allonocardiopsis opalescens TaxID=1144618 RepID=A0A2T0PXK5_9ACTN|nr:GntR family transcriptional regulator [Allonocardiopsis opalescens]PRX96262.1 GntR family transcriptional regulator [Allonocardiopsis opalescens]
MSEKQRVADGLRRQILDGVYEVGNRVPSRNALAREYSTTVRPAHDALDLLKREGFLSGKVGSGHYVRKRWARRTLPQSWLPLGPSQIDIKGVPSPAEGTPNTESVRTEAPEAIARLLGIEPGAPVVKTNHLHSGENRPYMLRTQWEPGDIVLGTESAFPDEGAHRGRSVVERMRMLGHEVLYAQDAVVARYVEQSEAELLQLGTDTQVLTIVRIYRSAERPVNVTVEVMATADFQLVYDLPVDPAALR